VPNLIGYHGFHFSVKLWLTACEIWRTQSSTQGPGYEIMANDTSLGVWGHDRSGNLKFRCSRMAFFWILEVVQKVIK
jgi:hypothetical protein